MKLTYLMFADNSAYCTVTETRPDGITVDLEKNTWRYAHAEPNMDRPVGGSRYLGNWRGGVIGVYDRDNFEHLKSMVSAAIESQRRTDSLAD